MRECCGSNVSGYATVMLEDDEEQLLEEVLSEPYDCDAHKGENPELEAKYSGMFLLFHKKLPEALADKLCKAITIGFSRKQAEDYIRSCGMDDFCYEEHLEMPDGRKITREEWDEMDIEQQVDIYLELYPDEEDEDSIMEIVDVEIVPEPKYKIEMRRGLYRVRRDNLALMTNEARLVAETPYLELAERLLRDWKEKGYGSYESPTSILHYHCSYVNRSYLFTKMGTYAFFILGLKKDIFVNDWIIKGCPSSDPEVKAKWTHYFGYASRRIEQILAWLKKCSHMQIIAAKQLHAVFNDHCVAYYFASVVENLDESEHDKAIREFYDFYSQFDKKHDYEDFAEIFDCFRFYYGIHLRIEGKHLPK